ncbi:MAG: WD40/YVTN/BNR-like repeat-containing protein [Fluviicola sp.]
MRKIQLLLLSTVLNFTLFAQSSWVNPAAIGSEYISGDVTGVTFPTSTTGFITSLNHVYRTTDGGHSWKIAKGSNSEFFPQYDIAFANINQGLTVGANYSAYTTNGGVTWVEVNQGGNVLNGTFLNVSGIGFCVGNSGVIRKTSNFGVSWTTQASGTTNALHETFFTSDTQGWAVGASGTILTTSNGGTTWTAQTSGTTQTLRSVYFITSSEGYACGEAGVVLKTTNGGTTWTALTSGTSQHLNDITSVSTTEFAICGANGTVLNSTDSGNTWTLELSFTTENLNAVSFSGTTQTLRSVYFITSSEGYACGDAGVVLKTINGGTTWTALTSGTSQHLNDITSVSTSEFAICGTKGTVLNSTDSGNTWTLELSFTTENLNAVSFSGTTLFSVGNNGNLAKRNAFSNWSLDNKGISTPLREVSKFNNEYLAVGNGGIIFKSIDKGANWSKLNSGSTLNLLSVEMINPSISIVGSVFGSMFRTTNGGTTWSAISSGLTGNITDIKYIPGALFACDVM